LGEGGEEKKAHRKMAFLVHHTGGGKRRKGKEGEQLRATKGSKACPLF